MTSDNTERQLSKRLVQLSKRIYKRLKIGGKKMKNFGKVLLICGILLVSAIGCGKAKNLEGDLDTIMTKLYANVDEDKLPMMLANTEITKDNLQSFTGLEKLDYTSGIASESQVGSIAHSVVLLRIKDVSNVETIKEDIKKNINPRKWVCVGVENVTVDNIGDVIVIILNDDIGEQIHTNFKNLEK